MPDGSGFGVPLSGQGGAARGERHARRPLGRGAGLLAAGGAAKHVGAGAAGKPGDARLEGIAIPGKR